MNGRTPVTAFRKGLLKPEPKKEEKIKTEKPPKQIAVKARSKSSICQVITLSVQLDAAN